ncbi:hypothetical protein KCU88_g30, partial [Aureobasidium melanogenum]
MELVSVLGKTSQDKYIRSCPAEIGKELVVETPRAQHTNYDTAQDRVHNEGGTGLDPFVLKENADDGNVEDQQADGKRGRRKSLRTHEPPIDRPLEQELSSKVESTLQILGTGAFAQKRQCKQEMQDPISMHRCAIVVVVKYRMHPLAQRQRDQEPWRRSDSSVTGQDNSQGDEVEAGKDELCAQDVGALVGQVVQRHVYVDMEGRVDERACWARDFAIISLPVEKHADLSHSTQSLRTWHPPYNQPAQGSLPCHDQWRYPFRVLSVEVTHHTAQQELLPTTSLLNMWWTYLRDIVRKHWKLDLSGETLRLQYQYGEIFKLHCKDLPEPRGVLVASPPITISSIQEAQCTPVKLTPD